MLQPHSTPLRDRLGIKKRIPFYTHTQSKREVPMARATDRYLGKRDRVRQHKGMESRKDVSYAKKKDRQDLIHLVLFSEPPIKSELLHGN